MAALIETIMDRGMDDGKLLQGLFISEVRHRCVSPLIRYGVVLWEVRNAGDRKG